MDQKVLADQIEQGSEVALVDGEPKTINLKQSLEIFVKHRREVVTRRTVYLLRKARERGHVLEGLTVALANIDPVILRTFVSHVHVRYAFLSINLARQLSLFCTYMYILCNYDVANHSKSPAS